MDRLSNDNLYSEVDELRSLLSAIAKGTELRPTQRIRSRLRIWLDKRAPHVFSEGLRELCQRNLAEPVSPDLIAEETYALWAKATIGMEGAAKETRLAFSADRLAMQYIVFEACRAGSEQGCEHAQDMAEQWQRITGLRAHRRVGDELDVGHKGSVEELRSLLSAVSEGTMHAPTHPLPQRLSEGLQRHDPTVFSADVRALCSVLLLSFLDLDSMARKSYGLCARITGETERASEGEDFPRWLDRLALNQILYELCGTGCDLGCELAQKAQEEWRRKITRQSRDDS